MEPKPSHWSAQVGAGFTDADIAAAYRHRPPYPPDAIGVLTGLAAGRAVLDLGCGTGDLARPLVSTVDRVDAVDASAAMLAVGRQLPGGGDPRLHWQHATAEAARLTPPYGLATAGESLHWMDWSVVLPRVADSLAPGGFLAIVERDWDGPLAGRLRPVFARYSTVRDFRPTDVVTEIERRGLFARTGERRCGPHPWRPTVAEYVECRHSQRGFARAHMDPATVPAFDAAVREALVDVPRVGDRLDLSVEARVVWGVPAPP